MVDVVVGGRVISGGHGRSFVVRLIVGRVVKIDESGELSELDGNSVDSIVEVGETSEVLSTLSEGKVELKIVDESDTKVVAVVFS